MKCFRLRCYVNNSFLVFHQGTKHSKTIKHSRFALVFHTVFSCLDPLMKHSNSLFTYNIKIRAHENVEVYIPALQLNSRHSAFVRFHPRDTTIKRYSILRPYFVFGVYTLSILIVWPLILYTELFVLNRPALSRHLVVSTIS